MSSVATELAPDGPVKNHVNSEVVDGQLPDDGDGDFIPVVKEKRKNKATEKQVGTSAASTQAAEKTSGSTKSGKSGHGSSRRRGRRSAASAAAAAAAGASGGSGGESGQPETGAGSDNGGTADEQSNDDNPKKFVEAPIPAVNVWKVSYLE